MDNIDLTDYNTIPIPQPPEEPKKKKSNKKLILMVLTAIVVCVVLVKGVSDIKNVLFKKKPAAVEEFELVGEGAPVKVYKVKRMDFKDTLPVLGVIKGYKEIPLKFQTSGLLESFNFEEGERIQEGDIIANLDQKDALLKLKYAELEMGNSKKLLDIGGITNDGFEKSRLEYESAKSDLEKTNIYGMSDGVLGAQEIYPGTYVTPNDKIGIFVDITKVYAEFNVIEKDSPKVNLGQKTEIFIDALPNKNFVGTVDTIAPIIEGRTRAQRVKVELKNPEGAIKPGMFTRGLISTYEKKNTIMIPASSLKKQEEQYIIFVVHEDNPENAENAESVETADTADTEETAGAPEPGAGETQSADEGDQAAEQAQAPEAEGESDKPAVITDEEKQMGTIEVRPIKISYMTQDKVEIESGLEEGELIVTELYQELQDKEKVEIVEVQEVLF